MENYRIHKDTSVYYITYTVVEWLPVFVSGAACSLVTDSLRYCHDEKGLRINAFVIMPTHIHAIVFDHSYDPDSLARSLAAFRQFTGRTLADFCARQMPSTFSQVFEAAAGPDRRRRFWQPTRHPVGLQSEGVWQQKLDYLHDNPRRKGLVLYPEEWRYSSARYYARGAMGEVDVPITQLVW